MDVDPVENSNSAECIRCGRCNKVCPTEAIQCGMGFKTDIEIAQECEMQPITEIAEKAGIDDKYLEQYGKYKAKIDYNLLKEKTRKMVN